MFLSLIPSTFIVIHERFSLSSFSTLYFDLSFTILFHFFLLMHLEQHTELDNLITMQNLRTSANKGSNDAYDVTLSLTGYEPNDMVFSELGDSQGSFSYITQSSDLDIDDATLLSCSTKHTENMPITAIRKACQSVSRRCLSCSIEQGNLWEKIAQMHRLGPCLMNTDR